MDYITVHEYDGQYNGLHRMPGKRLNSTHSENCQAYIGDHRQA
jgi:hypothetical protein